MAYYNVFVQDSSPLFIYSPPGAWIDTPLELSGSLPPSYHTTDVQGAMVTIDFIGTGVHVFSAITPTPGSYEVSVDGHSLSGWGGPSSHSDSQLLLGSITGLKMAPHTLSLVNSGMTGGVLNLAHVEVESLLADGSSSLSTATFDDTNDGIRWGSGWVSAPGRSDFYNNTVHYTEHPDANMSFLFEGIAIAIHGTSGTKMGYYIVTLDGQSDTFNGGNDGSVRTHHDKTILYLANGLRPGRHELTITANPSSLGGPQAFNVDCIRVLSGSSSSGPVLLPLGPPDAATSSSLPPPVSTGLSYPSVISSTVPLTPTPLPTSTSSTLFPSLMPSSPSTPPTLFPTGDFDNFQSTHILRAASNDGSFKVVTDNWVVSSAIISGTIAGIGLIFLALFIWKRKTLDPPSYIDVERANRPNEKGRVMKPGEHSPELPIQLADRPKEKDKLFGDDAPYVREPWAELKQVHSRDRSEASSITVNEFAYDSYWEVLQKRPQFTSSVPSTGSTYQDSVPHHGPKDPAHINSRSRGKSVGSVLSVYSDASQYSQMSERIFVNDVRMPPQFSIPTRPSSTAPPRRPKRTTPPRPSRVRESLALPF